MTTGTLQLKPQQQIALNHMERADGRHLCFWYHSTRIARAAACCRYRIGNLVEVLYGATAVVAHALPSAALRGKSSVIILRPWIDSARARVLHKLRRRGLRLVADFDDLLFDCAPDEYPPILQGTPQRALHEKRLIQYRRCLDYFDAFTVATEPLRERLSALRPNIPVHVVPNTLSPSWVRQGSLLYRTWQPGDPKIVRYLPGSPTHDVDFAMISEPLRAFLANHPEVRFEVVGPLNVNAYAFPAERFTQRPRVPFEQLAGLLASSWLTLAPLAKSEFNRCKSAIKYLEAAAFACPTVATPSPDVLRHADGKPQLAHTPDEWYHALTALLNDDRRMALGQHAQDYVLNHAMAPVSAVALNHARASWGSK